MEPSPKAPGICWERSLCLPGLGRRERGGCRGSPDPFQASSCSPPPCSAMGTPRAGDPRLLQSTGSAVRAERECPGEHVCAARCLRATSAWLGFIQALQSSCQQIPRAEGFSQSLFLSAGHAHMGWPRCWGSSAHRPPRCDGRWTPVPPARCHVEPGRVCSGSCPARCTRTPAPTPAPTRTGLCRAGAGARGRPPAAPGTVAPPALSNVSGGELIANTHGRALRVAAVAPALPNPAGLPGAAPLSLPFP